MLSPGRRAVPVVPHPLQHLLLSSHSNRCGVLICVSLVLGDVGPFSICVSSLVERLPKSCAHVFTELLGLLLLSFEYSGCESFVRYVICKNFLPICVLSFHSLYSVSFKQPESSTLMRYNVIHFLLGFMLLLS